MKIMKMMKRLKNSLIATILLAPFFVYSASQEQLNQWFILASAGNVKLYAKAEKALTKIVKEGENAVPFLISQLDRKNIRKVITAERSLKQIGKAAVPLLIRALADTNESIAYMSASILGDIRDKRAILPLMVAAHHKSPTIRGSACDALGKLGDTSAVNVLVQCLKDSIPGVRRKAALALGKIGDVRALLPILPLLWDEQYSVRYTAENAIANMQPDSVFNIVSALLDTASAPAKYHLIVLLGRTNKKDAITKLQILLHDSDIWIRGYACEALGYIRGDWQVANMLKSALWDNSLFVKMKSLRALEEIKAKK